MTLDFVVFCSEQTDQLFTLEQEEEEATARTRFVRNIRVNSVFCTITCRCRV